MSLFAKKDKPQSNKVVWRNSEGKIECPGDSCTKTCDDTCPFFLFTAAKMMSKMGHPDESESEYKRILEIAPDFYEAWNNLGAIYGGRRDYQKAYDCYKKAHELNPQRPNPVFGLALSSKDLGKYRECLDWCDEYDKMATDHRLDDARRIAEVNLIKY